MVVQATPVSPASVTLEDVRAYLRDYPDFNILLDGVEFSDEEISRATRFTVAKYNAIDRQTTYTEQQINPYILIVGTTSWLLHSEAHKQLRNQATYQDGGISPIGIDDKQALYANMAASMANEFDSLVTRAKMSANLEAAYDDLGSGYQNVARYHYK